MLILTRNASKHTKQHNYILHQRQSHKNRAIVKPILFPQQTVHYHIINSITVSINTSVTPPLYSLHINSSPPTHPRPTGIYGFQFPPVLQIGPTASRRARRQQAAGRRRRRSWCWTPTPSPSVTPRP